MSTGAHATQLVVTSRRPGTVETVAGLWRARHLLGSLIARELRGRYRGSVLGIGWAMVRPLALLAIYGVVLGQFFGASAAIPEFGLFLFVGLIAFNLFSGAVIGGATSITGNASLVKKVSFPRETLPLVSVAVAAVNSLLMVPILLLGYAVSGSWPSPSRLGLLIPATLSLLLLSAAFALFLGALNVYSRDIEHLLDVIMLFLFWLAPVLYAWTFAVDYFTSKGWTWVAELYLANPLSSIVIAYQNALWPGVDEPQGQSVLLFDSVWSTRLWLGVLLSLVLLWLAHRVFVRLQGNFAREL